MFGGTSAAAPLADFSARIVHSAQPEPRMTSQTIAHIALVVSDYDEAMDYYTRVLGFELLEDTPREPGKRWVLVAPRGSRGTALLLAKAASPEQTSRVGNQTGG